MKKMKEEGRRWKWRGEEKRRKQKVLWCYFKCQSQIWLPNFMSNVWL